MKWQKKKMICLMCQALNNVVFQKKIHKTKLWFLFFAKGECYNQLITTVLIENQTMTYFSYSAMLYVTLVNICMQR